MLFNSLEFLIFFPIVTTLYFILSHRYRWVLLLSASVFFYMAFIPYYILILLVTIIIDYFAGIKIENSSGLKKKLWLVASVISTCSVLFFFKYFNFFNANLEYLARLLHWNYPDFFLKIILPIGLSFHTFQSLSYVIEVYNQKQKAEHHFGIYSLYVMFYPQLVAGPIERPQNLLHQFYEKHFFDYNRVVAGLQKMLWGFFKKMVMADNLALYVNAVYADPYSAPPLVLIVATFFFALQIYCDFSGYSDIAIGSARVMGFKLMENFKNPYFSLSISEFWRRWHISLSSWFRDYVYIPLGGSRSGRKSSNIILTFLLSGFWHGANWTFVLWGLFHGAYFLIYDFMGRLFKKVPPILTYPTLATISKWATTFLLVLAGWVFFRANNVKDAFFIITSSLSDIFHFGQLIIGATYKMNLGLILDFIQPLSAPLYALGKPNLGLTELFILTFLFFLIDFADYKRNFISLLRRQRFWVRWPLYIVLILAIINLSPIVEIPFIYFQF